MRGQTERSAFFFEGAELFVISFWSEFQTFYEKMGGGLKL